MIDDCIARSGIAAPPPEDDPADRPWADLAEVTAPRRLDLARAWIGTVIWCTGFGADFSWLRVPVLDEHGRPLHERGVSPVPGLYFVGLPWLYKRKSGIICGVEEDAAHIAGLIAARPALAA
jgi:putative flavoprotein involved in K+ transport